MKKMTVITKLIISTLIIASLFVGASYLSQSLSETNLLAKEAKHDEEAQLNERTDWFASIETLSLKDYYVDELGLDPKIIDGLIEKYGDDINTLTMKDMFSGEQKEKIMYLDALKNISEVGEQAILTKNEPTITNKEGKPEVALNAQGEYSYSLETQLRDSNALSNKIDSATVIKTICKKYGIDPNGLIKDLTPDIIMEIDETLFEISDHPKN